MIIKYDPNYRFSWLEDKNIKYRHPVQNYYLKLNDLSINLLISLKWIEWGYIFFEEIKNELDELGDEYSLNEIIGNSIENLGKNKKNKKIIKIDDYEIENIEEYKKLLENLYFKKEIRELFDENTKVHIKLKLNLNEYLIISNMLYPTLIKMI